MKEGKRNVRSFVNVLKCLLVLVNLDRVFNVVFLSSHFLLSVRWWWLWSKVFCLEGGRWSSVCWICRPKGGERHLQFKLRSEPLWITQPRFELWIPWFTYKVTSHNFHLLGTPVSIKEWGVCVWRYWRHLYETLFDCKSRPLLYLLC